MSSLLLCLFKKYVESYDIEFDENHILRNDKSNDREFIAYIDKRVKILLFGRDTWCIDDYDYFYRVKIYLDRRLIYENEYYKYNNE